MKRGPNDINGTLPVKSLEELLKEVNNGQYESFRDYLLQNKTSNLDLRSKFRYAEFYHLGCALQGTAVTTLQLAFNDINAERAEKLGIALKDTAVTTLSFAGNNIGPLGAEKLGIALKDTAVTTLDLFDNKIGDIGAEKLGLALKGTAVTTLDLSRNNIGATGAEKLGLALQGTAVTALDLRLNNIRAVGAALLAAFIPGTLLMTVSLDSTYKGLKRVLAMNEHMLNQTPYTAVWPENFPTLGDTTSKEEEITFAGEILAALGALEQALTLNERKLIQTPYTATCLTHLPDNEKNQYYNLPALGDNPSNEEQITFAGGILAALGTYKPELQAQIISYLPLMNYQSAEKLQALAQTHHGKGLQIEVELNKNSKPKD